jgi:hypothetical protein
VPGCRRHLRRPVLDRPEGGQGTMITPSEARALSLVLLALAALAMAAVALASAFTVGNK